MAFRPLLLVFVLTGASVGCEPGPDDPCAKAKEHLCSKVESMNCVTAFMQTAVERIATECGQAEADRFEAAAAAYCQTAATFSESICADQ